MPFPPHTEGAQEHALLSTRLTSLTRSVALETRLRDSAAKLVRLSAPASALPPSNPGSPARPRVTREQAEAQLATAQAKLDVLESDLRKQSAREAELQGRLLRHTAGVLAIALRRKEEEIQQASAYQSSLPVASLAHRDAPSPPGSAAMPRFDGAHFFAGNREAIVPLPRSNGSPYASPQPGQNGSFGTNAVQLQHDLAEQASKVKELEGQVADLERALDATKQQAEEEIRAVKGDLDNAKSRASQEQAGAQERIRTLEDEVERLGKELDQARTDHDHARSEIEDARREVEEHRAQLATSGDAQRDLDAAKQEAQDLSRKLRDAGMELAEAQHKLDQAEERVKELEEELQRTEEEIAAERRDWEEKLKAAEETAASNGPTEPQPTTDGADVARVRQLESERQAVVQSIGDVLRRHRMRPTLGVALRESPAFDDTTERDNLPAYLSSTLDSHFDKLTSHVNELNSIRDEHDRSRTDLETELVQAHERCQNLEADVASLQAERDSLETELDLLRSQSQEHETRLASLSNLESQLDEARAAESRGRDELAAAQLRIAALEGQLGEHDKASSRLQELWQSMPLVDAAAEASPRSATAALPGRKQLGALFKKGGVASAGSASAPASSDFSVDNLVERVRMLSTEHQQLTKRLSSFEEEKGTAEAARKKSADDQASLEEKVHSSLVCRCRFVLTSIPAGQGA